MLHTLEPFLQLPEISEVIVVVAADQRQRCADEIDRLNATVPIRLVTGGDRRQDSVYNGVRACGAESEMIIVHDGGRPLVTTDLIQRCIAACQENDGAIAALPSRDTVKELAVDSTLIERTLDRRQIWLAQTPQVFRRPVLLSALENADRQAITGTDEASLAEALGYHIAVVEGSPLNIKITTPEDLQSIRGILEDGR